MVIGSGCNCFVPGPIAVFGILWVLWKLNPLLWFMGSAFWALALLVASGVSLGVFRVVLAFLTLWSTRTDRHIWRALGLVRFLWWSCILRVNSRGVNFGHGSRVRGSGFGLRRIVRLRVVRCEPVER